MKIRTGSFIAVCALMIAGAAGCAAAPVPPELAGARRAYSEAQASPAATLEPAKLYEARQALERAEQAFDDDPDAPGTRDLAYIAQRKAERVRALGSISYATRQIAQARRDYMVAQEQLRRRTEAELSDARRKLETGQRQLAVGQEQLAAERQARVQAEQRAKEAMSKLAEIASVRDVPNRGTVITLSGAVLFASGQANLLPIAQEKLTQVAAALKEAPDQTILIEGYTDSRGSRDLNEQLSLRRAQSVRDYLIAQGVPAERIRAAGRGPANPIADNATADGRANNRRVEIILEPAGSAAGTGSPTKSPGSRDTSGDNPYD